MIAIRPGPPAGPAALIFAGGPQIGRREGQKLARQELSEASFWTRLLHWFGAAFTKTAIALPGGWFGLTVLGVLIVLAVTVVVFWVRPTGARRASSRALLTGQAKSARDHRLEAEHLAEAGDFSQAIVELVRAIAVELEEREILSPRPGRTADELALEAGQRLPALAADLRLVTRLFDDVHYGDRPGTSEGYQLGDQVYTAVRTAREMTSEREQPAAAAGLGVPR